MKVLVTGAAGRIGRRVVANLLDHQVEVIAVAAASAELPGGVREYRGDLVGQPVLTESLVRSVGPDAIVHLAALAGPAASGVPTRRGPATSS